MARVGSKVTTSYADGKEPFRVLRTVEVGPEDLMLVRLGAETGMSDHSVDVLFEDLTIHAEALPGLKPSTPAPGGSPAPGAAGAVTGSACHGCALWAGLCWCPIPRGTGILPVGNLCSW